MDEPSKQDDFGERNRWPLAEFYLKRSEHSANFLRTLLFALSGGAIAFIANKAMSDNAWPHSVSILFFAISIATLAWSWEVQKSKSISRFKKLRDEGFDSYLKQEKTYETKCRNYIIDRFAFALIIIGFCIEYVLIICKTR